MSFSLVPGFNQRYPLDRDNDPNETPDQVGDDATVMPGSDASLLYKSLAI